MRHCYVTVVTVPPFHHLWAMQQQQQQQYYYYYYYYYITNPNPNLYANPIGSQTQTEWIAYCVSLENASVSRPH